jgi:serine/threonine protein kinase
MIPHLILNDIMLIKGESKKLRVKIDYKLSRFIDPKLDRPGPMLKRLLSCHPDIVNQRPLDVRSDIWSLGKIFVELLSADLETTDFLSKVDELDLPHELELLLKVMLADDPDVRPRSMAEVAVSLARIKENPSVIKHVPKHIIEQRRLKQMKSLQNRISILAALIILLSLAGFLAWYQASEKRLKRKDLFRDNPTYADQLDKLNSVQNSLEGLADFVIKQKQKLKESQQVLDEMQSKHDQLKPVVETERKVVETIMQLEFERRQKTVWIELLIGFVLGIVASIIGYFIISLVKQFKDKRSTNNG